MDKLRGVVASAVGTFETCLAVLCPFIGINGKQPWSGQTDANDLHGHGRIPHAEREKCLVDRNLRLSSLLSAARCALIGNVSPSSET